VSELRFLAKMNELLRSSHLPQRSQIGIGDDCAQLARADGGLLVTTDMLLDGVHFETDKVSLRRIGRKSLAVSLSDIAAMGGVPLYAFVSLALPRGMSGDAALEIMDGMRELAEEFATDVAGGDTNVWPGSLVINITLIGRPIKQAIRRSGARVGDWIMVSGALGGSIFGKHLDFVPRLELAKRLVENGPVHAMIDLSDGLATDLRHILKASNCGAVLDVEAIPISEAARNARDGLSPLDHALIDGEDFELCFTVDPNVGRQLMALTHFKDHLSKVGVITEGINFDMRDPLGKLTPVIGKGFEHDIGATGCT
jgi:thiamine-monophosphate kinase